MWRPPRETDGYVLSYYDLPLNREATSNQLYIDLLSQSTDYAWFFTPYLMLADDLRAVTARMGLACELSEQEGVSCMRAVAETRVSAYLQRWRIMQQNKGLHATLTAQRRKEKGRQPKLPPHYVWWRIGGSNP